MKKLIIVESPTKARTIGQYLGKEYQVLSSQGHVRDLPKNDLGVDVAKGFEPKFETKRTKLLTELKKAAEGADQVFLATDHDREGEAIAYDLFTILNRVVKNDRAFARPIFNEITKPVILAALERPEAIDLDRVEAQRTRRILDRLMGYMVSPLLSRTLAGSRFAGLSAGRVQSVALRFLCDREIEIGQFVPEEYWEIDAELENGETFVASVAKRRGEKVSVRSQTEADEVEEALRKAVPVVVAVEEKDRTRNPSPPFITSSLQQAASSLLGFSPKRTMSVAQALYEGISLPEGNQGLITYMRTDSVRLSDEAIAAARTLIGSSFGKQYLSPKARMFENKKRSQDAHEAIRPTDVGRTPEAVAPHLTPEQRKLYELIHGRFLATQMAAAMFRQRSVAVEAGDLALEATGSRLEFDGFLRVLPERRDNDARFPPAVREGQALRLVSVSKRQKHTEPPRRYSEAGLVNLLEKEGIGRPSTYASIVSVIQERGYSVKGGGSLRPTLLGLMVVDFLRRFFAEAVEPNFTAHLEEDLDRIEEGGMSRLDALNEFYAPFSARLASLERQIEDGGQRPFQVATDVVCEVCGAPMELRYWKGTHFLGCSNYPQCKSTINLPPDLAVVYGADGVRVKEALKKAAETTRDSIECATCGDRMELRTGRFGRYYRCANPECAATAPVSTGVACPSCAEGELVEKYSSKRRRTFYSCNRYPKCRFAVSDKPVKSCPSCGAGLLVEKQGELRCTTKDCEYRETVGELAVTPPPKEA